MQCLSLDVETSADSLQTNNIIKTPHTMIVPGFRQGAATQEHQIVNQHIADRRITTAMSNAPTTIGLVTALFLYQPSTSTWKKQGYT
jgi:hypothetical protein